MNQHRFLGDSPLETVRQVRSQDPNCFALADAVAEQASDLLGQLKIPRDDRLLAMALLYRRIVAAFEAIIVLAERGMFTEGVAVRRSQLEGLFVLGALWQKPGLLETYIANDLHRRRDIYAKIKKLSHAVRATLSPEFAPDAVDSAHAELASSAKGLPYMGTEQWALAAKLHDLYLTDYSFLSEGVHHVAKDIERHVTLNKQGDVESLEWGPERFPPSRLLLRAMNYTLMSEEGIYGAFQIGGRDNWSTLRSKLEGLQARGDSENVS